MTKENRDAVSLALTLPAAPADVRRGGRYRVTFEHLDIDPATTHDYAAGWLTCFGKLESQLRTGTEPRPV